MIWYFFLFYNALIWYKRKECISPSQPAFHRGITRISLLYLACCCSVLVTATDGEARDLEVEVIRIVLLKIAFAIIPCVILPQLFILELKRPNCGIGPTENIFMAKQEIFFTSKIENQYSAQKTGNEAFATW